MAKRTRKPVQMIPEHERASGLFYVRGEYVADVKTNDGRRMRRRYGPERVRALKLFDKLLAELQEGERDKDDPLLTAFLMNTFLPTQTRLKAYAFSEKAVRGVVRWVEATQPELRIRGVGRHHVEQMRTFYLAQGYAPRTVNMFQQKFSQALNHAVDSGLVATNPLARIRALTVDNRRQRFLSMDDFVRILDAAGDTEARYLFLVVGLTGLRPSNVRLLTMGEVAERELRIEPAKMKSGRCGIVPISRYVAALLLDRIGSVGDNPDALLFPARGTDNKPKSSDNLSRSHRAVARRLPGLEWSTLYDLRHFFASQLAKQGANEQQIGRLLCHVGQSVTSRYVHQDIEDLRHFVDELADRYLDAAGATSLAHHQERPHEDHITV